MTAVTDLMPLAGTLGCGFFIVLVAGYAIKKIIKIAAVIVGLFIAALAYMQYQRIVDVNWAKIQTVSHNGLTWVANTVAHLPNNIGAGHTALSFSDFIPLTSSVSAGFMLGIARG
jgi:uncharacterized membrane protein (Fun14 family)